VASTAAACSSPTPASRSRRSRRPFAPRRPGPLRASPRSGKLQEPRRHADVDDLLDLTSRVEATHFWFRGFRTFVAPAIAEIAGTRRDLQLLDCGCGTGHNLATLLRPYGRAYGFDLTPTGLLLARKAGFPLARADMSAIPFLSSRFDIVSSFDVMQYV